MVSRSSIQKLLDELLDEAQIPKDQVEVAGTPSGLAKRWKISFCTKIKGTAGAAVARVNKIFSLAKTGDSWRTYSVGAHDGSEVRVYLNRDLSPMQQAIEFNVKQLRQAVVELLGESERTPDVSMQKREGTIALDWHQIWKVICPSRGSADIRWHLPGMQKAKLTDHDQQCVKERFVQLTGKIPDSQLSI